MLNEKHLSTLRSTHLFAGISDEELKRMLKCLGARTASYKKGDYIYTMGDTIHTFGMVLEGSVQNVREDFWGNRTIINRLPAGEVFGVAYSFVKTEPLLTSVIAGEDSTVLLMNINTFTKVCKNTCSFHRDLIENMLAEVCRNNLDLVKKIRHTSQRSTRDKLLSYLSEEAQRQNTDELIIPFNRQELADYLCVERSAMSLELSKMQKDGLITYKKNRFKLLKEVEE